MRRFALLFAAISAAIVGLYLTTETNSAQTNKFRRSERPVPGSYIVMLDDDLPGARGRSVSERVRELAGEFHGNVKDEYTETISGFAVDMSEAEAIRLSKDPRVKLIEEDAYVEAQSVQTGATWGISRIDQRNYQYPLSSEYQYNASGAGVNVYVMDTPVFTDHPDFGGRASEAFDAYNDPTPIGECSGHGTHVAGTIGSATHGVAKNARIYSVVVLPCSGSGTSSTVLAGVDWVTRNAVRPAVANMSLASVRSDVVGQAVQSSINRGITYVVAAGNYNADACGYSPAHLPDAITVSSTDNRDYRDPNMNYGSCVDIFAPGVGIYSTWNRSTTTAVGMSGTSSATPHVAGAAALYLQNNPDAQPSEVSAAITASATQGILTDVGSRSPNLLLYTLFDSTTPTPSPSPTPSPTPSPSPSPSPTPPTACGGVLYSSTLSTTGAVNYHSSSAGFSGRSGKYSGSLPVPAGSNFRLILERKQGSRWSAVAMSPGGGATENLLYNGKSGTYRWAVRSNIGSGSYDLCTSTP